MAKRKVIHEQAKKLIEALEFIKPCQKKTGEVNEQFCLMQNGWLAASNGILTIATPIEEDLQACPHSFQLLAALKNVETEFSITQLSEGTLAVTAGEFRALVPCIETLEIEGPDPGELNASPAIQQALGNVAGLATDDEKYLPYAGVLLQSERTAATNGSALLEAHHGEAAPAAYLPKITAVTVGKTKKELCQIGTGEDTITFYFTDGAFIKSRLIENCFVKYQHLFDIDPAGSIEIEEKFFGAVKMLSNFSDGYIYLKDGKLQTSEKEEESSYFNITDTNAKIRFKIKGLLAVQHAFDNVQYDKTKCIFWKNFCRGVLSINHE